MPKYRKRNTMYKRLKKVEKKLNERKPEIKQSSTDINAPIETVQSNFALLDLIKGTNSNNRIGDEVKAISYYGVFYIKFLSGPSASFTNSVRMIHYLSEKSNEAVMEDQTGAALVYDTLPSDKSYIIKEDKLFTLSTNGPSVRKVIIKGKFRYPIRVKWEANAGGTGRKLGWHPRLLFVSDKNDPQAPQVNGQMRYYYTDI